MRAMIPHRIQLTLIVSDDGLHNPLAHACALREAAGALNLGSGSGGSGGGRVVGQAAAAVHRHSITLYGFWVVNEEHGAPPSAPECAIASCPHLWQLWHGTRFHNGKALEVLCENNGDRRAGVAEMSNLPCSCPAGHPVPAARSWVRTRK